MESDASLVPALEIAVTAIALIQGFAAARAHAHLNSARELAQRLGETLGQPSSASTTSGRAQAQELLALATGGLAPDPLAHRVVLLSYAWVVATTAIGVIGVVTGLLGDPVAALIIAVTATAITAIVAVLGTMDTNSVDGQLDAIRNETTVGLLASASQHLELGAPGQGDREERVRKAIELSSLAATKNPRLAWPPLIRAQAYAKLIPPDHEAADADIRRVYEADPGQAAGMLDEISRRHGLAPTEASVDWFRRAHADSPLEAQRRFLSAMSGCGRRLAEADDSTDGTGAALAKAADRWRGGRLLDAQEILGELDGTDAPQGTAPLLALLLNSLGDHTAAIEVLRGRDVEGDWRLLGYIAEAHAHIALGRVHEAQAPLDALLTERPLLGALTGFALLGGRQVAADDRS